MAKDPGYSGMHKIKPFCFGNIEKKRIRESRAMETNRKEQRGSTFNCNRNITDSDGQENNSNQKLTPLQKKIPPRADRKVLLAKWKEGRALLKNKLKEKQKPLFKVGIVHHNIASPVFRDISNETSVTKNKNVVKALPKKRNNSLKEIKKNVTRSTSKSNDISVFSKTTLSTGNVAVKPAALKNNVSPVNVFPFNKQKYTFSFKPVSNKKLTEPHSPLFMHSRVKQTQMNQKPLPKKPLFLSAKDNEDKDKDQLAHRLPNNLSVHEQTCVSSSTDKESSTNENDKPVFLTHKDIEIDKEEFANRLADNMSVQKQKCIILSYDHNQEQSINVNNKPVFSMSKDKEIDEEKQLKHKLTDNSSATELQCTMSSCDEIHKLDVTENSESLSLSFVSSENKVSYHNSEQEEIKEGSSESNGNNKEKDNTLLVKDTQHGNHTAGSDDSNGNNKENRDIPTVNGELGESSVGMNGELGKNSSEVKLVSDVNSSDTTNNENFVISPYITVHRGKRRSRGWRRRISAGLPGVTDECRIKSPNSVRNECSKFYRSQLDQETGRLLSLADDWEKTKFEESVPSSIADEIAGIVGQTRLLTRDKFQQVRSLVEQFENNDGPVEITKDDLAGFWEMIYLQVEKLNKSYSRLEELKNNKWQEKTTVPIKRRKTVVKSTKPAIKSRFRDFLQGKKMCENRSENSVNTENTSESPVTSSSMPSSAPIKQVVSSEGMKRYSASFSPAACVAMNSSLIGKALGHSPAILVHSAEGIVTPKSILKKKLSQSVTERKKTVLFGEGFMQCDVKSESVSQHDVTDDLSSNDPVITTNDQVATNNACVKTEGILSADDYIKMDIVNAASSSSNDQIVTAYDQMVTASDPSVTADYASVTTIESLVTGNSLLVTYCNPLTSDLNTPRRSSRLANKEALSSSKVPFSINSSCTDINTTVTIQASESASKKHVKKIILKPSSLSINPDELIKSNVDKMQKSKSKRLVKNKCEEVTENCVTESCDSGFELSVNTRRSKRLLQKESCIHRTVTFESGFSERSSSHYRKTPYKKRSRKSFNTEDE